MNIKNDIIKVINDNLAKNSEFEFVVGVKDLTLLDIYCIENLSATKNIQSKLSCKIIDNTYIKIAYSV